MGAPYPDFGPERDAWILSRRPARAVLNPRRPVAFFVEEECAASGEVIPVTTLFLTNRECPWRCLMCDLWKNTLTESVPAGAIPEQIDWALARLAETNPQQVSDARREIKLYNSGSFFDSRAIPPEDYNLIAERVRSFNRVIVECHPALVGSSVLQFNEQVEGRLEVALGLETVHPGVLSRLNKRMTLEQFSRAAQFLRQHDVAVRIFILVKPPFLDQTEALEWTQRSLDFAFELDASAVSLIPTRLGNGALEALAQQGEFAPPPLSTLEAAAEYGIKQRRSRVFADLWDLETFSDCASCFPPRAARLRQMNLQQVVLPAVACETCGGTGAPDRAPLA